jgi:hypothetical protein
VAEYRRLRQVESHLDFLARKTAEEGADTRERRKESSRLLHESSRAHQEASGLAARFEREYPGESLVRLAEGDGPWAGISSAAITALANATYEAKLHEPRELGIGGGKVMRMGTAVKGSPSFWHGVASRSLKLSSDAPGVNYLYKKEAQARSLGGKLVWRDVIEQYPTSGSVKMRRPFARQGDGTLVPLD